MRGNWLERKRLYQISMLFNHIPCLFLFALFPALGLAHFGGLLGLGGGGCGCGPPPPPCPPMLPPMPCPPPLPPCPPCPPTFCPPPMICPLPPPPCPPPLPPPPPCPPPSPCGCSGMGMGGSGGYLSGPSPQTYGFGGGAGGYGYGGQQSWGAGGGGYPSNDCCCQCGSPCRYMGRARTHGARIFAAPTQLEEEDPTCNSDKLRNVIEENISADDPSKSKRAIQKAAEERLFSKINVICAKGDFSYVAYTDSYCQASSGNVTCYAFRPLGLPEASSTSPPSSAE